MIKDDQYYHDLGLKSGLEIHQQLATPGKLFCRCPAVYRNDEPHATILRHMRPTLSEMGTYDGTALMEFKTKKQVHYEIYNDTVCTYELDDTPPFEIDDQALEISLIITKQMNCAIVDELHISRKQYLDGTIPTGFQRTGIVGVNGKIPFKDGRDIGIIQISIEEDACREMGDKGHDVWYRTDRLSIPLVEVVTEPDMKTPWEVMEGARLLGRLMRVNGRVRRGSGATRQDVNVSITGGPRIEIKGVDDLKLIPYLVAYEAERQKSLLEVRAELNEAGMNIETLTDEKMPAKDVTEMFKGNGILNMDEVLEEDGTRAMAVLLPHFAGRLGRTIYYDKTVAHEFGGRLKVIACIDYPVNQLNTDNMVEQGAGQDIVEKLLSDLGATDKDAVMVIWGSEGDTDTGVKEIRIRAQEMSDAIPNETRQAFRDGTNGFERILPGPDRMYPDTDSPPHPFTQEYLKELFSGLPEPPWVTEKRMIEEHELPEQIAYPLVVSSNYHYYAQLVEAGIAPLRAAILLEQTFKFFRRLGLEPQLIPYKSILQVMKMHKDGEVPLEAVDMVMRHLAFSKNSERDPKEVVADLGLEPATEADVQALVAEAIANQKEKAGDSLDREHIASRVMGQVMNQFRGRYAGSKFYELVDAALD